VESFIHAFEFTGLNLHPQTLKIILPVGISFYTFQALSYSIDVYRGHIKPTKDIVAFFAYVSFFPQLVAGPIERATNLLPQFFAERVFNQTKAVDGCRQILWGLFKKVVIADQCAVFANQIFDNYESLNGSALVLGALFFSFQIYGDFSGYSDIAIGTARLFGIDLMRNFAYPYFSRDIAEFWRRWHISLSTWFRDYLYIPLGGSRVSQLKQIRNTFIIFIVSGFWHGANWTFIIWGALNAIYFLPLLLTKNNRNHLDIVAKGRFLPSLKELLGMVSTFALVLFAWIFFRSDSIGDAFSYIVSIFSSSLFAIPEILPRRLILMLLAFLLVEWIGRDQEHALSELGFRWPRIIRHCLYYGLIITILLNSGSGQDFIYFQF